MQHLKRFGTPLRLYAILTIIFFILIAIIPASQVAMTAYNLSPSEYRILLFVVELPLAAVWFAAFYGYGRLERYAGSIRKTTEGTAFGDMARGVKYLAWGLLVPTMISLILNGLANAHPGLHVPALITVNYLNVLFPIIAFGFIARGTHRIAVYQRLRPGLVSIQLMMAVFIVLGVVYCFLVGSHFDRSNDIVALNPYHLPLWMLVFTIIIPSLYAWFIGLFAVNEILMVARHVKGVLYRQALQLLSGGMGLVIAALIALQYLRSVIPRTGHLSLNAVLVAVYIIYMIAIAGFAMISIGAGRLQKIEEI